MFKLEQIALDIAESLKKYPEQWTTDGRYYLAHKSGVKIWVANETYGIEVNGNKPSHSSRKHILKAYRGWLGWKVLSQSNVDHTEEK